MPPAIMAIHTSSYAGILNMDGALLHEGKPQARPDQKRAWGLETASGVGGISLLPLLEQKHAPYQDAIAITD